MSESKIGVDEKITPEASWKFAEDKAGKCLLHKPSSVVGQVQRVYKPGEYVPPLSAGDANALGFGVPVAVLGFESGDAFLADPANFEELTEPEVWFYRRTVACIGDALGISIKVQAALPLADRITDPTKGCLLMRLALQHQIRTLTPR